MSVSTENTDGTTGLCLEVHDLAISKYAAGRRKDLAFNRELARHEMIDRNTLIRRLKETKLPKLDKSRIKSRIEASFQPLALERGPEADY